MIAKENATHAGFYDVFGAATAKCDDWRAGGKCFGSHDAKIFFGWKDGTAGMIECFGDGFVGSVAVAIGMEFNFGAGKTFEVFVLAAVAKDLERHFELCGRGHGKVDALVVHLAAERYVVIAARACGLETIDIDRWKNDGRIAAVIFFDTMLHGGAIGYEYVDVLRGFVVGFFEWRYEKRHGEPNKPVETAKTRITLVLVVVRPIVADRCVAIANMYLTFASFAHLLCFGAGAADNDVVFAEVERAKGLASQVRKKLV